MVLDIYLRYDFADTPFQASSQSAEDSFKSTKSTDTTSFRSFKESADVLALSTSVIGKYLSAVDGD